MNEKERNEKQMTEVRKTPLGIERKFDRFGDWLDDSWALRKANPLLNRYPKILTFLTWMMRLAVGCVFIVSGLSKGIDPWGTYYKTMEYLEVMHIPIVEWGNTVLVLSFILFSVEFIIGVSLAFGCFRKASPIMAALFMLVMLPLTLWIAISDPVADCGCFGDFLVISNWSTFIKNCLISLAVIWLLKFNAKVKSLISPYLQWIAAVAMAAYIVLVGYVGYWQQPMIDFRPYKVGSRLLSQDGESEYIPHYEFIYEKDGEFKRIGEDDDIPDEAEGWRFVRREEKEFTKNPDAALAEAADTPDFRIWSEDGEEDVTEMLCGFDRQLILFVPDINSLSMATSWKINRLYDMAKSQDTEFFAVVAGSPDAIEEWRDLSSGQYPIYTAEDTSIKELVRGNPALVSLEDGTIKWKSALSALRLNEEDDDASNEIATYPIGKSMSGEEALTDISLIFASVLAFLILISTLRYRWSVSPLLSGGVDAKKNEEEDCKTPES
ncbi:MAG: DoxX family protein [Muribaculaceae bacterium]|nr:DoxX family protein [Muribaculaceae bacterium]